MSKIKIRNFDEADTNKVIDLILRIQNIEFNLGLTIDDQPELKNIKEYYLKNNGNFWVALNEINEIIGTISIELLENKTTILRKMFVKKEYRSQGIAKMLLDTLILFAENNQFDKILLDTPGVAISAHKFYEKNGFIEICKNSIPKTYNYTDKNSKIYELTL
ncbi:MAG: GNAT family N-acetyltransferase [bacterium]